MLETITTHSWVLISLLLYAVEQVKTKAIFDRDPYESRREALPGPRLLKSLVLYQMLKTNSQRGLVRASEQSQDVQHALGGKLARNTLSNAIAKRDLEQMIEAWMLILQHYRPYLTKMGRKAGAHRRRRCQPHQTLLASFRLGHISGEDRRGQDHLRF